MIEVLPSYEEILPKNEIALRESLRASAGRKGREFSSDLKMLAIKALNAKIVRLRKEMEEKLKQVDLLEMKRKKLTSSLSSDKIKLLK